MCKAIREGDEMACSCGLRWGAEEADPHSSVVIGVDPGHPDGDRSVVNGHVLYRASDFDEENEFSTVGIAVIDGGLQVCKLCGEYESGLVNICKGSK